MQLLHTYPRRAGGYPFAPQRERSVARAYTKALSRARHLVYLEDQYLWSSEVAETFATALREQPDLRVIAVVPHHPDQDGRFSLPPNLVGRPRALALMRAAGGDRVAVCGIENLAGTPVYVHTKVCVSDDVWATIGSDNVNRRSWTHDSELTAAVIDEQHDPLSPSDPGGLGDGARRYARALRMQLMPEHLDIGDANNLALQDPDIAWDAFRSSAADLQTWYDGSCRGPGRLRPLQDPPLSAWSTRWATAAYHYVYDPDGQPRRLCRTRRF